MIMYSHCCNAIINKIGCCTLICSKCNNKITTVNRINKKFELAIPNYAHSPLK